MPAASLYPPRKRSKKDVGGMEEGSRSDGGRRRESETEKYEVRVTIGLWERSHRGREQKERMYRVGLEKLKGF